MLKSHSAGIGDTLRGSAAWRTLRNAFPDAELHLALLTNDPGSAAEMLLARHHLLQSFVAVDKRTPRWQPWRKMRERLNDAAARIQPDLVIDFEPNGLRTSLMAWEIARKWRAITAGIGQFPGRGLFYRIVSEAPETFARRRGLKFPLEYTNRDFVVLSAFGIERCGTPIELEETEEAKRFRMTLRQRCGISPEARIVGLNIGCGTADAVIKRPDLKLLQHVIEAVRQSYPAEVVLTGAKFERSVNAQFLRLFAEGDRAWLHDLAGETNLLQLCGAIRACDLFISTDSGPYHMAVGLKTPTLALFKWPNPIHYHHEKYVRCLELRRDEDVPPAVCAAMGLLSRTVIVVSPMSN